MTVGPKLIPEAKKACRHTRDKKEYGPNNSSKFVEKIGDAVRINDQSQDDTDKSSSQQISSGGF